MPKGHNGDPCQIVLATQRVKKSKGRAAGGSQPSFPSGDFFTRSCAGTGRIKTFGFLNYTPDLSGEEAPRSPVQLLESARCLCLCTL
jgi:hypothetical protein